MARMISFFRAHKRVSVITLLWVVFCAFWLIPNWREGPFYFLFFSAIFVMLIARQLFWIRRVVDLGERFIPGKPRRAWLTAIASVVCLFFFAYNFVPYSPRSDSTHLTLRSVVVEAPFWWWFVGAWAGFGLVMVFWMVDRAGRAAAWVYRRARKVAAGHPSTPMPGAIALDPPSLARRRFVEAVGRGHKRRSVYRDGSLPSLRAVRRGSHSPAHCARTPAQRLSGLSYRAAFRLSH